MGSSKQTKFGPILSLSGVIVTTGIVFGDIGTSPLYVFQAILNSGVSKEHYEALLLGGVSCVFWTLAILATVKYIYFALNADNKGEGGIFALYALLKQRKAKWIVVPALIGCATLMADGFITPAISISSAVEGMKNLNPHIDTMPIVIGILFVLFLIQQFGTSLIGKAFGPIMLLWFGTLCYLGIVNLAKNPEVLKALNPYYAYNLIVNVPNGFWVMGAISLCITGAEALYSDLGHCGKGNIRVSWSMMSIFLLINYFGQTALCLSDGFSLKANQTVFFAMVPEQILPYVIVLAAAASIIASQALITGVFTLMNEAIKLKLWTNLKVKYPTEHHGQIYIPAINWFLLVGCLMVVLIFQEAERMEAAYGLAITTNMVMTSFLLCYLLFVKYPKARLFYGIIFLCFLAVEIVFLLSNLGKIVHGGWFALILSIVFFVFLFFFYQARLLRGKIVEYIKMDKVVPLIEAVRNDKAIPYEATNLVYPTRTDRCSKLDVTVFYSLFRKKPRKADIIWFLHLDIKPEPWGINYSVNEIIDKHCYYVSLQLGFKEEHRIEFMIRKIHKSMVEKGEISGESIFESVRGKFNEVDFKFVILNSRIASDNDLTPFQIIVVKVYRFIKRFGLKSSEDLGLDQTNVVEEYIPIHVAQTVDCDMKEEFEDYSK